MEQNAVIPEVIQELTARLACTLGPHQHLSDPPLPRVQKTTQKVPVTEMKTEKVQVPTSEIQTVDVTKPVTRTKDVTETVHEVEMKCAPLASLLPCSNTCCMSVCIVPSARVTRAAYLLWRSLLLALGLLRCISVALFSRSYRVVQCKVAHLCAPICVNTKSNAGLVAAGRSWWSARR